MNIKSCLANISEEMGFASDSLVFPDCELIPENIKTIMIDEAPHKKPDNCFYSKNPKSGYMRTTLGLFKLAGIDVNSIHEILDMGIYITTALKIPRDKTRPLRADEIKEHVPILEKEIALFPNLKIIMLNGNTSVKAFNYIIKAQTGKSFFPTGDISSIRINKYEWNGIRIFPSYMVSNRTILSDEWPVVRVNTVDDIREMAALIQK